MNIDELSKELSDKNNKIKSAISLCKEINENISIQNRRYMDVGNYEAAASLYSAYSAVEEILKCLERKS